MKHARANGHKKSRLVRLNILRRPRPLRLGFLPLNDCAPLVAASEFGLFRRHGLNVQLVRQTTWTSIRDKIVHRELDAAHAPATLPFITTLGLDCEPCDCVTGLVLSLQGNAITLSRLLWEKGVRDAAGLRGQIHRDWGKRTYAFGIPAAYSTAYFLLKKWLDSGAITPELDLRIVVIPPGQMFPTLRLGYLDGYCVSEPWTSVAVEAGAGMCVGSSTVLAPLHPEKVLMVTRQYAENNKEQHEHLIAALLEACALCEQPENRKLLARLLALPDYVNAPTECCEGDLATSSEATAWRIQPLFGSNIFYRYKANDPTEEKAAWVTSHLLEALWQRNREASIDQLASRLQNVFQRETFKAGRRKALRHLKQIESGMSNLEGLQRIGVWAELRQFAAFAGLC